MKTAKITTPIDITLREARELLRSNDAFLRRKVRVVAQGNELEDKRVEALFTLAVGRKFQWTPQDWKVITDKLDSCELTVGEWLDGPHTRT